jgi:heme/copper-type cytochrome/quinol oxidase subunit 2
MTERDMMFLVMILIVVSTLTVIIWQFVRSRRRRGEGDRGNWWEGPWDDDRKG